jgi:hypothetical protein
MYTRPDLYVIADLAGIRAQLLLERLFEAENFARARLTAPARPVHSTLLLALWRPAAGHQPPAHGGPGTQPITRLGRNIFGASALTKVYYYLHRQRGVHGHLGVLLDLHRIALNTCKVGLALPARLTTPACRRRSRPPD